MFLAGPAGGNHLLLRDSPGAAIAVRLARFFPTIVQTGRRRR
jgi:hypothetical protein